jgi:cyclase
MTRSILLCLLVLFLPGLPSRAQDFDKYDFAVTKVAGRVTMLAGAGGNIALCAGDDGALLVDDDYAPMGAKLVTAVAAVSGKPVRFVVSTHWHFDHVEGNEALAKAGAVIFAHENIRRRMAAGQTISILDHTVPPAPAAALPNVCFADSIVVHTGGEEVRVLHLPHAHTDGDAIVLFRDANVVHAGDVFFNCGYPFIDISSGGTIDGLISAVEKILALCDEETRIIPGHGPIGGAGDLRTYLGMLREFREIVAREFAAGKSLEEIVASKATAGLDEKWGSVFFPPAMFTEMVFRSLAKPD